MRTCVAYGCTRKYFAKGWCEAHYAQIRRGEPLQPIRGTPEKEAEKRNEEGLRLCTRCKKYRPEEDYYQAGKNAGKLRGHCKRCNIVRRMNITAAEYDAMFEAQGGVCAICERPPGARALSVDHDHTCCPRGRSCGQCIRGLLCDDCNNALGRFQDDVTRMLKAVEYVSQVTAPKVEKRPLRGHTGIRR